MDVVAPADAALEHTVSAKLANTAVGAAAAAGLPATAIAAVV